MCLIAGPAHYPANLTFIRCLKIENQPWKTSFFEIMLQLTWISRDLVKKCSQSALMDQGMPWSLPIPPIWSMQTIWCMRILDILLFGMFWRLLKKLAFNWTWFPNFLKSRNLAHFTHFTSFWASLGNCLAIHEIHRALHVDSISHERVSFYSIRINNRTLNFHHHKSEWV